MATWYKKKIKDSILAQVYENKNKVAGVNIDDPQEKQRIYERYLQAFKKGAYNYIKEEIDPVTEQTVPRKYFSGGVLLILPEIIPPTSDQVNRAMTGKDFSVVVEARFDQAIIENLRTISAEQPIRQISFGIGKPNLRTSLTSEELGMVEANPQKYYVINQGAYAGLKQFDSNRERWISYNTSLRTLNNEFDLLDKIKKIHQQDKSKKVIILDWGCGNSVGTIELDKTLTEAEIPHHIYGLSSDLYSQWQGGSQNITFILDDAMNLYRYLSENMVDIIFSHTGLIHVLDRSSFRDFGGDPTKHLNDLVSILRPGGVLIMDIFVLRTARNLEFLSQPDEFKFHGRLFIKKRTAKATYFEFTKDAASEEKDAAMAGTQSLTIQDGLAIVEKLFTDSELQETWRLQMDDNHSGSPLMAPNIEFIAGAWLPHFQQIMQQNGYSPQVFIQEIEQGGLNSDTLNFIKASLKNGGNI